MTNDGKRKAEDGKQEPEDVRHPSSVLRFTVSNDRSGQRLDQAVTDHLHDQDIARARVQSWIKDGQVMINGRVCLRSARRLVKGETIQVEVQNTKTNLTPEAGSLSVIHQDEHFAVLNKPAGLVVHPAPGLTKGTLVHLLLHQFPTLQRLEGVRPGIVHRLDKDTTGLLVVALNESARLKMAADFAARSVEKTYLALVHGVPARDKDVIEAPIGRHPALKTRMAVVQKGGKEARSTYQVLWADPLARFSLLGVRIQTGRTHQIRVHLQHLGHPLLGDPIYSAIRSSLQSLPWADKLLRRPMLHAWRLSLPHPATGKITHFQITPPKDFQRVLLVCSRRLQRVGLTGLPGCGKSMLLNALAEKGLPGWSADAAVRELYKPGRDGWELLRRRFGTRFVPDEAGAVDTTALLAAMRQSSALRREVEAIIHPLAAHLLEVFWREHAASRAALAEVPLLLESGWQTEFDMIVGLFCPDRLRRQWLKSSRGWDPDVQADVESWQRPGPDKLRACNLIVENPGELDGMRRRAAALTRILRWLRRRKVRLLSYHIHEIFTSKD
jgi:23S rRNA pseudouridine1911/1915/1917 synthase